MSERRQLFDESVRAAHRIRNQTETRLAATLASELQGDLIGFDPTRLQALSPTGLKTLVGTLMPNSMASQELDSNCEKPAFSEGSVPQGWLHLRQPETNSWIAGINYGMAIGTICIACATIARMIVG